MPLGKTKLMKDIKQLFTIDDLVQLDITETTDQGVPLDSVALEGDRCRRYREDAK